MIRAKLGRIDLTILLIVICFMIGSTLVIMSATTGTRYEGLHKNNLIMYAVFFVPLAVAALLDYRLLVGRFAYVLYGLGIVLLLLVQFKGINLNGSTRWINLGGMQFQPSELVKLSLILLLAKMLGDRQGEPLRLLRDLVPLLLVTFVPMLLILMQPDLGTSIVLLSIMIGMLWMGNIRWVHILAGAFILSVVTAVITALYFVNQGLFSKIIKPHQLGRIQTFLDPTSDPDKSWHVVNSIRAIGSGQFAGKGFQQGSYVQNGFIPYDYADSIFVVIGEELGFIGVAVLLLLYFLLFYRMIMIAARSEDLGGTYLIVGVISMLMLQIFENIAMHVGMMPLTGIALPFVSYGGSSLLTNMLAVGLAISVGVHQPTEARFY